VTVCVAALCRWNYSKVEGQLDMGWAILTLADRMITVGDTEYEPNQQKFGQFGSNVALLIAGDYSIHSQAILETRKQLGTNPTADVHNVAQIYGQSIQRIKLRIAENQYLAPLGLNADTFIAQQREMAPSFVDRLTMQLQHYEGDSVEAIIAGVDGNAANIYHIDNQGTARCYNDVGFVAIGVGAWHARSRLTQAGYVNTTPFVRSIAVAFAAKKAAEAAPGVGKETDIHILYRSGSELLYPPTQTKLNELYLEYQRGSSLLANESIKQLDAYFGDPKNWPQSKVVTPKQESPQPASPSSPTAPEQQPSQSSPETPG
jgi:hypothetical protein